MKILVHQILNVALVIVLASLLNSTVLAQNESRMELFEGGDINMVMGIRSNLFTGAGVRGAYGGLIAPIDPEPFVIFGNPAALARIDGRKVAIASSPTIEFDLATLSDPNPSIAEQMDARLESFDVTGPKTNPKMIGTIGRMGSLVSGFALALPVYSDDEDRWFGGRLPRLFDCVAFGYTQPLTLHTGMVYSGLRTRLRTIEETPENEILLYASIKMDVDILISSDAWNLSIAREMGDYWLGLGLQRTAARVEIHGNQRTDGIMSRAGTESSFNDPQSPWDDDYYSSAHGTLDGSSLALRLGGLYEPTDNITLGAMLKMQGPMEMDADLDLQLHSFKPLKLSAAEGEKQFDVNAIQDASELTRTEAKIFEPASKMDVSIPSELALSITWARYLKPTFTFTKYFGELAYTYDVVEDGALFTYKRGFKANMGVNLGLDLNWFQVGLGGVTMVDVVKGYHDARGNPIPPAPSMFVPRLSVGFDTALSENLRLGVLIYGLPEDALRFTLEYSL